MTDPTPKYSDLQQRRLKALGEALLALTPQQRQDAIKIAGNLLTIKAKKRAAVRGAGEPAADRQPAPAGDDGEHSEGAGDP